VAETRMAQDADEPLHRRLETPRLFKVIGLIRRSAAPSIKRELGLSDFEWRIMSQVGDRAPMSLNELALVTGHDKGQLSRGVKRLVEAGILVRQSRRGERGVFISPTEAGKALFDRLAEQAVRRNQQLIRGLSAEELKVLSRVIETMEANALELLAREDAAEPLE
jgi:DNA-binding MarR family transcriptional regulator